MSRPGGGPAQGNLTRDALTGAGYTALAGWGWFLYGFAATIPLLRDEQQVSRTVIAWHSVAMAAGSLVSGAAAVGLARRVGRRGSLIGGCLVLVAGLGALIGGHALAGLLEVADAVISLPAALVAGVGGSLMVNTVNSALTEHHAPIGAAAMSEGAAAASLTGLLVPLALAGCAAAGWSWRPALALALLFPVVVVGLVTRIAAPLPALDGRPPTRVEGRVRMPRAFWWVAGALVTCVGLEFAVATWAADLLRQRASMSPGTASIGVSAILAGMLAGRALLGRLARRRDPLRLMLVTLAVTAVGWAITWWATAPVPALAGLAVIGLGIAGHYPLSATLALDATAGHRDRGSGLLSIGIGVSAGAAPFALAAVADLTSTRTAFLLVPLLLVGATLLLAVFAREQRGVIRSGDGA